MRSVTENTNFITINAFLLSLFFHLFFLNFFIFTFTPGDVAHKPLLVFLGSILQKQDISAQSKFVQQKQPKETFDLLTQQSGLQHIEYIRKPLYTNSVATFGKQDNKTTFEETPVEITEKTKTDMLFGVPTEAPKRLPLKIDRR